MIVEIEPVGGRYSCEHREEAGSPADKKIPDGGSEYPEGSEVGTA
jgi:hypothetical protein